MMVQKRRQRLSALVDRLRSARARLAAALQSMDYEAALSWQLEVDHLQREVRQLEHWHGHQPYPMPDVIG
jgi:hypothetical protein